MYQLSNYQANEILHKPPTGAYNYIIHTFYKVYQRPNLNSVTCVQPNGYILFMARHAYVPG